MSKVQPLLLLVSHFKRGGAGFYPICLLPLGTKASCLCKIKILITLANKQGYSLIKQTHTHIFILRQQSNNIH